MYTSSKMNDFLLYPNTEDIFPIYRLDKDINALIQEHPEWIPTIYYTCYKLYLHKKLELNYDQDTNTIDVGFTQKTIPNIVLDTKIQWDEEKEAFRLPARRDYKECFITGAALLIYSLHIEMCQLDPLDHRINLAIMTVAIRLGIVTSPFKQEKPEDHFQYLFEFVPMRLASLTKANQITFFKMCETQRPILVTGSTGIGKTVVFPILVWRHDLFFTGYEKSGVLSSPELSSVGTMLALPRKIMVAKAARSFLQNSGFELFENSFVKMIFQGVLPSENNTKINNFPTPFFVVVDALAGIISNIHSYIFDEIHEHSTFSDIYISVFLKRRKRMVLITATIEKELEMLQKKIPSLQHIHVEGPTRFHIEENPFNPQNLTRLIVENQKPKTVKIVFCSSEKRCQSVALQIKRELASMGESLIDVIVYTRKIVNSNPYLLQQLSSNDNCLVVVATNILESSVTIDRATEVYDFGNQYSTWYREGRTIPITMASYLQRKGRVGRVQNGKYYRCFDLDQLSEASASINNNYITELLVYLNTYHISPKDLIVSINDMTRVEKTYQYYNERGIDLRKQSSRLVKIMKKHSCLMLEYIIIYLLGTFDDIELVKAIDYFPTEDQEDNFMSHIKSYGNEYRKIAQTMSVIVKKIQMHKKPYKVLELTNYEKDFDGYLRITHDLSNDLTCYLLHPLVII